jgi:cell division protein FtsB
MKEVNIGMWGILTKIIIVLLIAASVAVIFVWYLPLIQLNQRLRRQIILLNQDIQKEEVRARQLKVSITALQHDPKTVERLLRERLGYAKPGETVIRFETPANNTAPGPR